MNHWAGPERRAELIAALKGVAWAPLSNVFREPSNEDPGKFAILTEALDELEPGKWRNADHSGALKVALYRALRSLPDDERPASSSMSWQEIGLTLYGFVNGELASKTSKPTAFKRFRQVVRDSAPHISEAGFKRLLEEFYQRLAASFLAIKPNAENETLLAEEPLGDSPVDTAELVAEVKARWASPTAYNVFDLDTREGVRDVYRQMMEDAAFAVCMGGMSVEEVVDILKGNKARPDLSGHDADEMAEQVWFSAQRLQEIFDHETGAVPIFGRVIDEQGNVVENLQQVAGSSVRCDKDGEVVGDGPNLISDSEVDAWLRGVLEYSEPADIAAGTLDAIRVLAHYVRVRLERSVEWQRDAEQASASEPNNVAAQQHLLLTERETKRQLAAADALREAMRQTSPAKVRCFAENVLWHDISMGAAGNMNIERLIERLREDEEFKQYRNG